MAYDFSANSIRTTFTAGADLSTHQFKFVEVDNATGRVTLVNGATDRPIGVLQNTPKSGEAADVLIAGGTKVVAGGTASPGEPLFTAASAVAITLAVGVAASNSYVLGTFVEPAAEGAITTAVINCANAARGR
jgi:hypothetical protein